MTNLATPQREAPYLDLDVFFAEHPELRPPEALVRQAARTMGVVLPGEQRDMFDGLQPEREVA